MQNPGLIGLREVREFENNVPFTTPTYKKHATHIFGRQNLQMHLGLKYFFFISTFLKFIFCQDLSYYLPYLYDVYTREGVAQMQMWFGRLCEFSTKNLTKMQTRGRASKIPKIV